MPRNTFLSIFRLGVRQKMMLVLITVLLTGLTVSGWLALEEEKDNILRDINQRGSDISRFVAKALAYSVVGYDYHTLQLLLDEIAMSDDVGYAKVTNAKGNTMAESGSLDDAEAANLVTFKQDIALENEVVGSLTLGLSTEHSIRRLESQKYSLMKREAFIIVMIALGEFFALSFIIMRPVSIMSRTLKEGVDENGQIVGPVPISSKDEFGQLAMQFNFLSAQLNKANLRLQTRIDAADEQLLETNRQLVQQSDELRHINDEFKKLSITDSLTGLYNRRRFEDLMATEMEMSLRHGDTNSLLIIDIDHFKKVNDLYGHPGGDRVLEQVAKALQSKLRKTDILCRIGGEEFVALCKRATKAAATEIGEKLRQAVETLDIPFAGDVIRVTISVGIATVSDGNVDHTADNLYRQADVAVYRSKDKGRNVVTHFDDTVDTNSAQDAAKQNSR